MGQMYVDGWASEINTGSVRAQHRGLQGWTYGLNTGGLGLVSISLHIPVLRLVHSPFCQSICKGVIGIGGCIDN